MDKEAKQLGDAFIASGEKVYSKSYILTRNEEPTGEKVLVLVLRTNPQGEKALKEFAVGIQKAVAGPKGMQCPMCGGTGIV